jgi:hypothetical protein
MLEGDRTTAIRTDRRGHRQPTRRRYRT